MHRVGLVWIELICTKLREVVQKNCDSCHDSLDTFFPLKFIPPSSCVKRKCLKEALWPPPPGEGKSHSHFFLSGDSSLGINAFSVTRLHSMNACIHYWQKDWSGSFGSKMLCICVMFVDIIMTLLVLSYQKMKCSLFNAFKLVLLKISLRLFRSLYWALTASNDSQGVHCPPGTEFAS